ncbi:MAG: hypothetical protein Crog4KO_34020 [Crocinitomicaceae bacterium]
MKKAIVAIFALFTFTAMAQQNQLDALKEIGNGTVMKGYRQVKKDGDKYTAVAMDSKYKIEFVNNMHGKLSTFRLIDEESGKVKINSGFDFIDPNHYTAPSLFCTGSGRGYVYLDGLLYCLNNLDSPQDVEGFKVESIYIAKAKKDSEKKLTMKERVAAAKAAMSLPTEITDRDHKSLIEAYLKSMLPVQESATANLSQQENDEIAKILQAQLDKEAGIAERNEEFWQSDLGQRKLEEMQRAEIILVNDTGSDVGIYYGSGASKVLKPGDEHGVRCSEMIGSVYHGLTRSGTSQLDQGELLYQSDGTNCGARINISSL